MWIELRLMVLLGPEFRSRTPAPELKAIGLIRTLLPVDPAEKSTPAPRFGTSPPPSLVVPMKLLMIWLVFDRAPETEAPAPTLPEITFRAEFAGLDPPMRLPGALTMATPFPPLPSAMDPETSVPM
jgi:hypothetical protein